ncbi:MAG: hypothetical protein KUF74_09590 [Candidatus Thiodiazotropha sp. (ex Ctena orbiculata)]|nr:hypothetical protein [Candidatus Thiodiazotropha taylori]
MFTVNAGFIGDFKLGDNINHNLKVLAYLYQRQDDPGDADAWLLRKPAIILIGSICEAILHDLHMRMNLYTVEGVKGITATVLSYVRGKKIDKFETYIASAKKHSLLGASSESIYSELEQLRKLRNRVHIQNEKKHFEDNDSQAFSAARQVSAEEALEKLIKTVSSNHPRPAHAAGHVNDFNLPWGEHFP